MEIPGEEILASMEEKLQSAMRKWPFETRVAASKWLSLQAHGYVSDRRTPEGDGLIIYKINYPKIWGTISWWGEVNWRGE